MKKAFIRVLSPVTLFVIAALDCAAIGFAFFAVKKIIEAINFASIIFAAVEVLAIIIAILVTKEMFSNGINFYDDKFEYTGIDDKNVYKYSDIAEVETYQDTKASLKKNFIDRHTLIIITLTDQKVATVDIGLCSKSTLKKIKKELAKHINEEKIK